MNSPKHMLVYLGNPGIGKTYLCAAMFQFALEDFQSFRYHTERDLMKRIRETIQSGQGDYLKELKYLTDDPLVFLDDVGSEKITEHRNDVLFEFIDQRYNCMSPTVITSNFSVKEFKELYHPRLCSRLFSKENTIIEILRGVDLRQ